MTDTATAPKAKPDLEAETLTPQGQRYRFIEARREAGASEDEAEFNAPLRKVAKLKG